MAISVGLEADHDAVLLREVVDLGGELGAESGGAHDGGAQGAGGHDVEADVGEDVLLAHAVVRDAAQVHVAAVGVDLDTVVAAGLKDRVDLVGAGHGVLPEGLGTHELDLGHALGGDVLEDRVDRPVVVLDELLGVAVAGDCLLDAVDDGHDGDSPQFSVTTRVLRAEASSLPKTPGANSM